MKSPNQARALLVAALILALAVGFVAVTLLDASSSLSIWVAFGVVVPLQVALVIGFSIHAIKFSNLPGNSRWLWVVAFFVCSLASMPVYWFRYLWSPHPSA
jgi:hypothetical protein